MSNDNRLISLIQLDSDRAKWVEFLDAVKKKGFKEREDFFPHVSGNPSALFKANVANDVKLKDLRKKFNVTSFGLESVEASSEIKSSLYERGDKVKVLAGGAKYVAGTIVEAVFGDSHYKVQLENGSIVSRNQHEISFLSESDKIVKSTSGKKSLSESLDKVGEEDSDVNNDGTIDSTDDYLKHRRTIVSRELDNMDEEDLVDEALNLYELDKGDNMSEYEQAVQSRFDIPVTSFSVNVEDDGLLHIYPNNIEQFEADYGQFMQEEVEAWLNETFNALEETMGDAAYPICTKSVGSTAGTTKRSNWDADDKDRYDRCVNHLEEDHLSTKEDKIQFILSNSSDYTKDELDKLDDETIDDMYKAVEVNLTEDNDAYAETGEEEVINKFNPNYDFFGEGSSSMKDELEKLNDDQIEELSWKNGVSFRNKKQAIKDLLDFADLTKEDLEVYKGKSFDDELEETLTLGTIEDEATGELRFNSDSEDYKRYDAMSPDEWKDAQYEATLEDKSLVYDSINDEYVISDTVLGGDDRPQDIEIEENFEVNEDDYNTIRNIAEGKGWKVKSVTGLLKESQHESLLKVIVEKKGITATVMYDDDATVKPWSWEGKQFNFLQEALDSVYIPLKAVLSEAVSKEKAEIKQKEKEVKKLLERRKEAYKTDGLSKTEQEIRAKRSQEIFNKFMDDDLLKRGF